MRNLRDFICCAVLVAVQPALSAQLTISRRASDVQAVLSGVAFPSGLPQDLKSGLTNTILIHLELLHDSNAEAAADIRVAVRYDLWDEVFLLTETEGNSTLRKEELGSVDQVMTFLARLPLPNVFGIERLPTAETYRLRAHILLNPIEKERLDNLRKWVAENAGAVGSVDAAAPGALGPGVTAPAGAPAPNSLFNRIFRGYSGVGASATWLETVESKPFIVKELAHDGE